MRGTRVFAENSENSIKYGCKPCGFNLFQDGRYDELRNKIGLPDPTLNIPNFDNFSSYLR